MTEELRSWLRRYWVEFKQKHGRSPDKAEWERLVQEAVQSPEDPLCGPRAANVGELARESFQTFDISDARADEILRKIRDAITNAYCRKYVDGSF